jgi:hypothetical protein
MKVQGWRTYNCSPELAETIGTSLYDKDKSETKSEETKESKEEEEEEEEEGGRGL